ncbi:MAG: hypothetical protein M1485_07075 [Chloroflexi bacterium]|nr:hypothetical protein [Chloroflexota bacterium]
MDWYHASQYLTPIAEAAFGANTPQAHEWLTQICTEFWDGRIQDVIQSCRSLLQRPSAKPWIEKAITYYTHNEQRMDYARFRQLGYLISSGTIESACEVTAPSSQTNRGHTPQTFRRTLNAAWCYRHCQSQSCLAQQILGFFEANLFQLTFGYLTNFECSPG